MTQKSAEIDDVVTDGAPAGGGRDFGLALVVVVHGETFALCYDGPANIVDHIRECFRGGDIFAFNDCNDWDHEAPSDGVFVVELRLIDDGPGDAPGSRECALQAKNFRVVTATEWTAHCGGEWPWEPFVISRPMRRQAIRQRCRGCGAFADEPRSDRCEIGDVGHCDIDVDQNGRLLPWSMTEAEEVGLNDESFRALLGDDEP